METKREIARREPPAAGLAACLRRNADDGLCSHKIKNAQLRTQSIPLASSKPVSFAGLLPNGSAHTFSSRIPILKTIARKFIMNYVRRDKDRKYFRI